MKRFFVLLLLVLLFLTGNNAAATDAQPAQAPEDEPGLDRMLGAMLMFGFRGVSLPQSDNFVNYISKGDIAGFIIFDKDVTSGAPRNVKSPEQLKSLCSEIIRSAPGPVFIGVDQEGGQVRRLRPAKGFMDLPSAQAMGQGSIHDTMEMGEKLGAELKGLGINVDLAPVVDVDTNPFNPVIGKLGRAFNSDAALVAAHALAFGQGLAKQGVIPVLKHFPGQGCAQKDSHLESMDVGQCWNANVDLLPYAEIFKAGWPGMVMVGHINHKELDSSLPASLSKNIITGLLRKGLGWQGVVISDDMQMKAVTQGRDLKEIIFLAIDAGTDILLFGNNLEWDAELPQKVLEVMRSLVAEKRISEERIRESWKRISDLHAVYENSKVK